MLTSVYRFCFKQSIKYNFIGNSICSLKHCSLQSMICVIVFANFLLILYSVFFPNVHVASLLSSEMYVTFVVYVELFLHR